MMSHDPEKDDDELDRQNTSSVGLLTENKSTELPEIPMCGFLSVRFYQPYFDVDTADVVSRLAGALFYCKRERNFLALIGDRPDAYGPFWISTTAVFVIAVASHVSNWLSSWMHGQNWAYDFQSIVTVSTLVYGFAIGAPVGIWFVLRQWEQAKLKLITVICLYGYSLLLFIPAASVCVFPSEILSWLVLLGAGGLSSLFLLRSLAPIVVTGTGQHASLILAIFGLIQIVFALALKLSFFQSKTKSS